MATSPHQEHKPPTQPPTQPQDQFQPYADPDYPEPPRPQEPLKVLFSWKSKARPFKKRTREFYSTAGSIIFLVCIILLFIKEFLAIVVLIAFAFLIYVLGSIEPEDVEHQITNRGMMTSDKLYPWDFLGRYWLEDKWHERVLFIENYAGLPTRLMIIIDHKDEPKVKDLLNKRLLEEKPESTQMERAGEWLQQKVPLESIAKTPPSNPTSKK